MATPAMSDAYTNVTNCFKITDYVERAQSITIDPAIVDTIAMNELVGLDGNTPAAGTMAYPVYTMRESNTMGEKAIQAGIVTEGIYPVVVEPGAVIGVGDSIGVNAARQAVGSAAGVAIGVSLDISDGSGTVNDPHYVRVMMDRHLIPEVVAQP